MRGNAATPLERADRHDPLGIVGATVRQRYSVDFFVGAGRSALVYRGTQLDTLCPVALKFLPARTSAPLTPAQRDRVVQRLGELTAPLADVAQRCPTFAETIGASAIVSADGRWVPFVAQTWLEGVTLEAMLADERDRCEPPRTLGHVIDLLTPVADALQYAHARGVVHGAIAPRCLHVREEGPRGWAHVEIADLGMARLLAQLDREEHLFSETGGHRIVFPYAYGAPEQFLEHETLLGPATDVFALALVIVELLTGRPPLGDGDDAALARASTDPHARPTPRALGEELGQYVEAVFARALAVDPAARYANVGAFWDALRAAHRMPIVRSVPRASSGHAAVPPAPVSSVTDVEAEWLEAGPSTPYPFLVHDAPRANDTDDAKATFAPLYAMPESFAPAAIDRPSSTPTARRSPGSRASRLGRIARGAAMAAAAVIAVVSLVVLATTDGDPAPRPEPKPLPPVAAASPAPVGTSAVPSATPLPTCPAGMALLPGRDADASCIDFVDVTVARYERCVARGACRPLPRAALARGRHVAVDAAMAAAVCEADGARLATDAEASGAAPSADHGFRCVAPARR